MKSKSIIINVLVLSVALSVIAFGQSTTSRQPASSKKMPQASPVKASKAATTTQAVVSAKTQKAGKTKKTDSEMQECIREKLGAAPKLSGENINVTVENGKATFTGSVKNGSSKGGVASIARSCGCNKVANNLKTTETKSAHTPVKSPAKPTKPGTKH